MKRSIRPAVGCAVVVVLAGLLTQGWGLRTPSGVRVDQRSVDVAADDPDIRKLPPGPTPGASPQEIVRGFLVASAADPQHDFAQAFLAEAVPAEAKAGDRPAPALTAARWTDRDAATVYAPDSVLPLTMTVHGTDRWVRLQAQGLATLSSEGALLPAARRIDLIYHLTQNHGQWRLSYVPPGVLLTPRDLLRGYLPVTTYGYNPDRSVMVAEPGYIASDHAALAGGALRALLTGWGNASTPFGGPARNVSALGSVVVRDGVATVDLARDAFLVTPQQRSLLLAQIAASLGSVPGVSSVRVLVEERPYVGGPVSAQIPAGLAAESDGPALGTTALGRVASLSAAGTKPLLWLGEGGVLAAKPVPQPTQLTAPIAGPDGTQLAALQVTSQGTALLVADVIVDNRRQVVTATERTTVALPPVGAGHYLQPQWLDGNHLLVAQGGPSGRLMVADVAHRTVTPVSSPGLPGLGALTSLAVSRDGTRVVAIAGPPGAGRAYVGRITPATAKGTKAAAGLLTVASWSEIPSPLGDVTSASWSADLDVTLAGHSRARPDVLSAWVVALDTVSDAVALPSLPASAASGDAADVRLVSAPGRPTLLSSGDRLWQLNSERWVAVSNQARALDISYP